MPVPLEISTTDARLLLTDHAARATLIDCRTPEEHRTARISGARLIPLDQFAEGIDDLEGREQHPILVYCHHGVRSLRAVSLLRARGFELARSIAGGIDAWSLTIDPSVPRY